MDIEKLLYIIQDASELGLIWAIMALGVFISYRVLDFADLTAEGTITLGGAIVSSLILKDVSPYLATLLAFVGGLLAGIITGVLHTKFKIPAIVAGIITMTGLFSINLRIMGKASLYLSDKDTVYTFLVDVIKDNNSVAKILTTFVVLILITLGMYWFFGTEIGMSLRSTGMNQKMSRAQGINTNAMIILGLALSNGLVAVCGALIAQSTKSANMDVGKGTIVIGLASIILGEVLFGKRTFKNWLIAVILGSIAYQLLAGTAIALGLNANDLKLLQAILIAIILSLPIIKPLYKNYLAKRRGGLSHGQN